MHVADVEERYQAKYQKNSHVAHAKFLKHVSSNLQNVFYVAIYLPPHMRQPIFCQFYVILAINRPG